MGRIFSVGRGLEIEECHAECAMETTLQNKQKAAEPTGASHQWIGVCLLSPAGVEEFFFNQLSCHCDNSLSLFLKIIFDVDHF